MQRPHLGVTAPISTAAPTPRDMEVSTTLIQELKDRGSYEGPEEGRLREVVLGRLNTLVKQFVYRSSLAHGFTEAKAKEAGGKIFTFGSYRLGVHGPGSDIDTLLVVPKHVEREEFFSLFEEMLKATDGVLEVTSVPDAYVPIIKCEISGIEFDLLFARLALPIIPDDLELRDDSLLRNLDERCVRSLGGSRVTDEILHLVPDTAVFREALRTIKLWAQRRAIYSNVMGFCGGVAWAMLVARICQLYPNGCVGSIISRFFIIMTQWQWPQPVLLKPIEEGPLQVRVWNPKLYPSDRSHRMPIITPAYPSMCSTHNVSLSTQSVMTAEFKRAAEIVDKVIVGSAPWSELFAPHEFFIKYRYYLQITASSSSADTQLKWSGTVESKVRQLVSKLEFVDTIVLAHPYTKGFDRIGYCADNAEYKATATGEVLPAVNARKEGDLKECTPCWTTTFYIGLMIEKRPPPAPGVGPRKLDISYPTNEFTKAVKMWDKYVEGDMGIIVRYIKSSALPAYVMDGKEPPAPQIPKQVTGKRPKKSNKTDDNTTLDDDAPRSNKKPRPPTFVPEGSAPPPPPHAPSTALAAAEFAINGTGPDPTMVANGSTPLPDKSISPDQVLAGSGNGFPALTTVTANG